MKRWEKLIAKGKMNYDKEIQKLEKGIKHHKDRIAHIEEQIEYLKRKRR